MEIAQFSEPRSRSHIVHELGFTIERDSGGLRGSAAITPEMHVPGTSCLRTSILATWIDLLAGLLACDLLSPRVPVTLDLDVHLHRLPRDLSSVEAVAQRTKAGRSVLISSVELFGDGTHLGIGSASFMAAPDAKYVVPSLDECLANAVARPDVRLTEPFADRARCMREGAGRATIELGADGKNSSNSLNGGLAALAVEEAVLSATPGAIVGSLAMRYLSPVRQGPAVAIAVVRGGLGQVEVQEAGRDHRVAITATTRSLPI